MHTLIPVKQMHLLVYIVPVQLIMRGHNRGHALLWNIQLGPDTIDAAQPAADHALDGQRIM